MGNLCTDDRAAASRIAQANANSSGQPRYLHMYNGTFWCETSPCDGAEKFEPKPKKPIPPHLIPWKKGQSGNPAGRKTAGANVREWFNSMANWDEPDIEACIKDKQSPRAKVAAAIAWKFATSQGITRTGAPVFLPVLQEITDRTDGKSHQQISIQTSNTTIGVDLSKLSVDQLKALQAIIASQHGDKIQLEGKRPEIIDAVRVETKQLEKE